ncbi:MAG: hypothetical protein GY711_12350 [bacterium]|nr:hypothetical protein [bacterium]
MGGGRALARRPPRALDWTALPDDELLDWRLCDLGLELEGTALQERLDQLDNELERAGLRFRPYAWLSSDWFTPDGATGFAIPFFLAHTRLMRLERAQMLEVEGGTHEWCMKLLRHETAHAIDNAYRMHRQRRWRDTFGRFSEPYRASYTPDPTSRDFVQNLDYWYAQSHPAEDWAETFAIWLRPGGRWRKRYASWPAIEKIEFVDGWMKEIADQAPPVRTRSKLESVARLKITLREYYSRKRSVYDDEAPTVLDRQLRDLFSGTDPNAELASAFLRRQRRELGARIARRTGQNLYLVDHVLREMIPRCRKLRLRLAGDEREAALDAAILLTALGMQFLYGGHPEYKR